MKVLNRVGGFFLLLVLGIAAITGFQSPTGRPIWDNLWNATASVLGYARNQAVRLDGSPIKGHPFSAIGVAAILVLALIAVVLAGVKKSIFLPVVHAVAAGRRGGRVRAVEPGHPALIQASASSWANEVGSVVRAGRRVLSRSASSVAARSMRSPSSVAPAQSSAAANTAVGTVSARR